MSVLFETLTLFLSTGLFLLASTETIGGNGGGGGGGTFSDNGFCYGVGGT